MTDTPAASSTVSAFRRTRYFHEATWLPEGWPQREAGVTLRIDTDEPAPSERTRAWLDHWLQTHHASLLAAVLERFFSALRENPGWFDLEDRDLSSELHRPQDVLREIVLRSVMVHGQTPQGEPVLGLEFDCSWDEEHGAGMVARGVHCVQDGGGDIACLRWCALEACPALRPLP